MNQATPPPLTQPNKFFVCDSCEKKQPIAKLLELGCRYEIKFKLPLIAHIEFFYDPQTETDERRGTIPHICTDCAQRHLTIYGTKHDGYPNLNFVRGTQSDPGQPTQNDLSSIFSSGPESFTSSRQTREERIKDAASKSTTCETCGHDSSAESRARERQIIESIYAMLDNFTSKYP